MNPITTVIMTTTTTATSTMTTKTNCYFNPSSILASMPMLAFVVNQRALDGNLNDRYRFVTMQLMCMYVRVCMSVCVSACVYACVYACVRMHVCMHVCVVGVFCYFMFAFSTSFKSHGEKWMWSTIWNQLKIK